VDTASWQEIVLLFLFAGFLLWKIAQARAGKEIFIRKIPGLQAIDEAVGRAAEMGSPILFQPGIESFKEIQTLAALGILQYVAKQAARLNVPIFITTPQPVMVPTCENILKTVFDAEGNPELIHSCSVRFVSPANDLAALGTVALINDHKIASACYFGSYDYTSLLYTEGGQMAGAMQIAGTADYYQIPFFIASCDYVVMVDELFASSAYLSRDPTMLGGVVSQDYGKLVLVTLLIAGVVSVTVFGMHNPLDFIRRILNF